MTPGVKAAPLRFRRASKTVPASPREPFLEVRFEIAESWFDLLSLALSEAGCLGLEFRDGSRAATLEILAYFPPGAQAGSVFERLLPWLKSFEGEMQVQCRTVADEDWNRLWRSTYLPVEISERLVIIPAWSRRAYPGRTVVRIRPEQAFGTGSHETTRMCLEALAESQLEGRRVADIGTGSGILAIAAARLGAGSVYACDPDPLALVNARHNIRLNRVAHAITLAQTDLVHLALRPFDVMVANLVLEPLREGMHRLKECALLSSQIYLSGLLEGQERELIPLVRSLGMYVESQRVQNHWLLLQLRLESTSRARCAGAR